MTSVSTSRSEIAHLAADAVAAAGSRIGSLHAVVGFDAFIDAIIHPVDQRRDMSPEGYTRIRTIAQFAARAGAAAGKSTNIEMVVKEERFGGNGPLMAGALGQVGAQVLYIGAVGQQQDPRQLHPTYGEFAARCQMVIPVAPPASTDALEFDDGKIMLGKPANIQSVTWEAIKRIVGVEDLIRQVDRASVIGMVNWVMMGGVEGIWRGLCEEVFPKVREPRSKRVFIDLCDPAKRTDEDVKRALGLLKQMDGLIPVTLGLNQAEAERIAAVLNLDEAKDHDMGTLGEAMRRTAIDIRAAMGVDCIVVHPREGAASALASGESAWFDGPFTRTPKLSTGAGDHFNAGFALGQCLGLPLPQSLAVACALSGAYVRDAGSPTLERLVEFLRQLPAGEPHS